MDKEQEHIEACKRIIAIGGSEMQIVEHNGKKYELVKNENPDVLVVCKFCCFNIMDGPCYFNLELPSFYCIVESEDALESVSYYWREVK